MRIKTGVDEAMEGSPRREFVIYNGPAEGDMVMISVSGPGWGIAADVVPPLVEPLITTKQRGMGVGLSMSPTIIEARRGWVTVEPDPEGGIELALRSSTNQEVANGR